MFKLNLIIILCTLSHVFLAQSEVKDDFKMINEYYNNSKNISMDIKYELFYDGSSKPTDVQNGKYVKSSHKFYMQQGMGIMVITDKHMLVVDHEKKIVILDKKIDEKKLENPLSLNLDSLYTKYSKIEKIDTKNPKTKAYRFYITQGPYSVCDVYYDVQNKYVTEIINVFRYKQLDENEKLRLTVLKTSFMNYGALTHIDNLFKEANYFLESGKKIELNKLYKTYQLINHLDDKE